MKLIRYWKNPPPMKLKMFKRGMAEPDISRGNKVAGIVKKTHVKP
jgi:hypothetical protein